MVVGRYFAAWSYGSLQAKRGGDHATVNAPGGNILCWDRIQVNAMQSQRSVVAGYLCLLGHAASQL